MGGWSYRPWGGCGTHVAAGADVRRRAGRTAVEGDEVVGRAVVGTVGPVRDGVECEGMGVGVLRRDGTEVSAGADVRRRERADVAAGADVRRRADRAAVEGDEVVSHAAVETVGPIRDGVECDEMVLRGGGTDVSAGADVRRRERRGAVENDETIDCVLVSSGIVR